METLAALLGCSILLGVPLVIILITVNVYSRLKKVESELADLRRQVHGLPEPVQPEAERPAPVRSAPEPAPAAPEPRPVAPEPPPVAPEPPEAERLAPPPLEKREPPKPARRWNLEELIGAKLLVWIGAAAMALGGAFLVMISFAAFGPGMRVASGVLLGAVLMGAGEWLRRSYSYLAQGLTAAGVAALFAAFYAAVHLYALVGPVVGFILMALTTAAAVVLSLRQGIIVAAIGLVGGFLTPALVSGGEPNMALLFSYLLLLQGALILVTRKRQWPWLAFLNLAAGFFWVVFVLASDFDLEGSFWVGTFLILSSTAFVLSTFGNEEAWGNVMLARFLGLGALAGSLIVSGGHLVVAGYGPLEWLILGLLSSGSLVLGRLDEKTYSTVPWLAAMASAFQVFAWGSGLERTVSASYFWTTGLFGALFALGGYLALSNHALLRGAPIYPRRWANLSAAGGVGFFLIALNRGQDAVTETTWGLLALLLAAVYAGASWPFVRRHLQSSPSDENAERAASPFLLACAGLVGLAIMLLVDSEWLGALWAVQVLALVFLAGRLRLKVFEKLAWVFGVLATFTLISPQMLVSPMDVFDWQLAAFGIAIVAFGIALGLARAQESRALSEGLAVAIQLLVLVLVSLEAQLFLEEAGALALWGTWIVLWLALAHLFLSASRRWPEKAFLLGSSLFLALAAVVGGFTVTFTFNPLWSLQEVGSTFFFNLVLWCYGVPAALLGWLAVRYQRGPSLPGTGVLASVAALVATFLFVSLEVRQAFAGSDLSGTDFTVAENYTYSFAWLLLGVALVVAGVARRSRAFRIAAMPVILLTILKVFLMDTAHLAGGFRVASLMGLGAVLLGLAFVYQRYVVPKDLEEAGDEDRPVERSVTED